MPVRATRQRLSITVVRVGRGRFMGVLAQKRRHPLKPAIGVQQEIGFPDCFVFRACRCERFAYGQLGCTAVTDTYFAIFLNKPFNCRLPESTKWLSS